MAFNTRNQFITAQASEKITLVRLSATGRVYNFILDSGSIYKKTTDYFVNTLTQNGSPLTKVNDYGSLVNGSYYYDAVTSELYCWPSGSVAPTTIELIATYQFFFSTVNIDAPWNMVSSEPHVLYQGRIIKSPGYKHKVGIEQALTSLIGTGDLSLINLDGGLDEIFDTLFFENQECFVYSWNRDLSFNDAKLIYRGRVTNKAYDGNTVSFTIKDQLFDLEQQVPQGIFLDTDDVKESSYGRIKRWVYGKVDGLLLESLDPIEGGYTLAGTVSILSDSYIVTGSGTSFLNDVTPGDTVIINGIEYGVESVDSDTQITIDDLPLSSLTGLDIFLSPENSNAQKNREFFVTQHAGALFSTTLVNQLQLNRVELASVAGLSAGEYLEFDTGERALIKNIAPNNIIVLQQALTTVPTIGQPVTRQPIQNVYIKDKMVSNEKFTISNLGAPTNELKITLADDAEFEIARAVDVDLDLTFTNGSRTISTAETVDLKEYFKSRDFIRPAEINYTTYYEILDVGENSILLRTNFADPTTTDIVQLKSPDYITDDTPVSADVLGRTEDGEPSGIWITTAAQAVKDLLSQLDISNINTTTFDEAEASSNQLISLALPLSPSKNLTKTKDVIDYLNKSIYASLTLDENLNLQYRILKNDVPQEPVIIKDSDVIDWKIKSTNGKTFSQSIIRYRHTDYNKMTEQSGSNTKTYTNEFVQNYLQKESSSDYDVYLYKELDAEIASHRFAYFNRLGRSDMTIETDLRFENLSIGDTIQVEFARLYKRFGDVQTRKKLMFVVGLTKTGDKISIEATDLNNTFNTSAVMTPNTAPDYVDANANERLKYGYITNEEGIVNNEEQTANINLIS